MRLIIDIILLINSIILAYYPLSQCVTSVTLDAQNSQTQPVLTGFYEQVWGIHPTPYRWHETMTQQREQLRFALPSKGRLSEAAFAFLDRCGLRVFRPNSRQYIAQIPSQPNVQVILQRPGDIGIGVRQGSLDFGITGYDVMVEKNFHALDRIIVLHDALGFGKCTLNFAAPDDLGVDSLADLQAFAERLAADGNKLRVASKFPNVSADFLDKHGIANYKLIDAEGTLEIAPMIGFADVIVDLVESGQTLRDNHLHTIDGGEILKTQTVLIGNRHALTHHPEARAFARTLLEYIEGYLRAKSSYLVVTNVRGESAEAIANKLFDHDSLSGLRGPTISPIYTRDSEQWFSVSLAVKQAEMQDTIAALRQIGGSGVIVTPATYIFEEEPVRYRQMLTGLGL